MATVMLYVIPIFITILAYWHRDRWLYTLSGLTLIIMATSFIATSWQFGLLLLLLGVYSFFKAAWGK